MRRRHGSILLRRCARANARTEGEGRPDLQVPFLQHKRVHDRIASRFTRPTISSLLRSVRLDGPEEIHGAWLRRADAGWSQEEWADHRYFATRARPSPRRREGALAGKGSSLPTTPAPSLTSSHRSPPLSAPRAGFVVARWRQAPMDTGRHDTPQLCGRNGGRRGPGPPWAFGSRSRASWSPERQQESSGCLPGSVGAGGNGGYAGRHRS